MNGTDYMVSESNYSHAWSFSPGVSIFIRDSSEEAIKNLFDALSTNGGQVMVPLDAYNGEGDYGFGKKYGWCEDKYGVSWQFLVTE